MAGLPILDQAMAEIKAVMDKYDIGGNVTIHSPGHWNYLLKLDPSYSAVSFRDDMPGAIDLKFSSKHYNGDKSIAQKKTNDTVNLLESIRTQAANVYLQMDDLLKEIEKITGIEIDEKDPIDTSDRETHPAFQVKVQMRVEDIPDEKAVTLKTADLSFQVAECMDASKYLDEDGYPGPNAIKPITITLLSGLIANVRMAATNGWFKEGEHMKLIFETLEMFHTSPNLGVEKTERK
jgi:hypothetical protein